MARTADVVIVGAGIMGVSTAYHLARLGVRRDVVRWWVRAGYVTTRRDGQGHHVIWADEDELRRLRSLHQLLGTRTAEGLDALRVPKPRLGR